MFDTAVQPVHNTLGPACGGGGGGGVELLQTCPIITAFLLTRSALSQSDDIRADLLL